MICRPSFATGNEQRPRRRHKVHTRNSGRSSAELTVGREIAYFVARGCTRRYTTGRDREGD